MDKIREKFEKYYLIFQAGFKVADLLPTEKVCPECEGSGAVPTQPDGEPEMCKNCETTGKIPIYYTPADYKPEE